MLPFKRLSAEKQAARPEAHNTTVAPLPVTIPDVQARG
jgi:hypothetical protein